jgi:predicted amidohydrolase
MNAGLSVTVAQPERPPETHDEALDLVERLLASAPGSGLLVLPELALCGYANEERIKRLACERDSDFVRNLQTLTARHKAALITGMAERDGDRLYNAALAIGSSGQLLAIYRKVNLWGDYENRLFSRGEASPVFAMEGFRTGILVCHDLDYPETARDLALRGADMIIVLSATNHRYRLIPDLVAPTRAYENTVYVVYADATGKDDMLEFLGHSRILSPTGATLASLDGTAGTAATAILDHVMLKDARSRHPYLQGLTNTSGPFARDSR